MSYFYNNFVLKRIKWTITILKNIAPPTPNLKSVVNFTNWKENINITNRLERCKQRELLLCGCKTLKRHCIGTAHDSETRVVWTSSRILRNLVSVKHLKSEQQVVCVRKYYKNGNFCTVVQGLFRFEYRLHNLNQCPNESVIRSRISSLRVPHSIRSLRSTPIGYV